MWSSIASFVSTQFSALQEMYSPPPEQAAEAASKQPASHKDQQLVQCLSPTATAARSGSSVFNALTEFFFAQDTVGEHTESVDHETLDRVVQAIGTPCGPIGRPCNTLFNPMFDEYCYEQTPCENLHSASPLETVVDAADISCALDNQPEASSAGPSFGSTNTPSKGTMVKAVTAGGSVGGDDDGEADGDVDVKVEVTVKASAKLSTMVADTSAEDQAALNPLAPLADSTNIGSTKCKDVKLAENEAPPSACGRIPDVNIAGKHPAGSATTVGKHPPGSDITDSTPTDCALHCGEEVVLEMFDISPFGTGVQVDIPSSFSAAKRLMAAVSDTARAAAVRLGPGAAAAQLTEFIELYGDLLLTEEFWHYMLNNNPEILFPRDRLPLFKPGPEPERHTLAYQMEKDALTQKLACAPPLVQYAMLAYCDKIGVMLTMAGRFPELKMVQEFPTLIAVSPPAYTTRHELCVTDDKKHHFNWAMVELRYQISTGKAHLEVNQELQPTLLALNTWRQLSMGHSYLSGPSVAQIEAYRQLSHDLSTEQLEFFEGIIDREWLLQVEEDDLLAKYSAEPSPADRDRRFTHFSPVVLIREQLAAEAREALVHKTVAKWFHNVVSTQLVAARDEAHTRLNEAMMEMVAMKTNASAGLQAAMKAQEEQHQWTVASYLAVPGIAAALGCSRSSAVAANGLHHATVKKNLEQAIKQAVATKTCLSTADALLLFTYGKVVTVMWEAQESLLEAQTAISASWRCVNNSSYLKR